MSQENLRRAREVLAMVGKRDLVGLVAMADPEVEWQSFFAMGEGDRTYHGHEGTHRYMSDLDDAFEIGRADIEDALAAGNVVVLVGRIHYRGKRSGVQGESPAGWMLKFRKGKLLCFRAFREPEHALEAVGLSE